MEPKPEPKPKAPYLKPKVSSTPAFEASLACLKVPGSPMCAMNIARAKS